MNTGASQNREKLNSHPIEWGLSLSRKITKFNIVPGLLKGKYCYIVDMCVLPDVYSPQVDVHGYEN